MDSNKRNEFLIKLATLLEEYNASISFACSENSDTSGLYNSRIIITERKEYEIILDTEDSWYLSSNIIENYK